MYAMNDAQLAKELAPHVMRGLKIMSEESLEPEIEKIIESNTHRSNAEEPWYDAGGAGSLSQAWSNKVSTMGSISGMGVLRTYYDSDKLIYDDFGKHQSPWAGGEKITDMATLIDLGKGGLLWGDDNPTRTPTHFWDKVIATFESNQYRWIKDGLKRAGLNVW